MLTSDRSCHGNHQRYINSFKGKEIHICIYSYRLKPLSCKALLFSKNLNTSFWCGKILFISFLFIFFIKILNINAFKLLIDYKYGDF